MSEPPRPSVVVSALSAAVGAQALEPGHDDDLAVGQLGPDAGRVDVGDPGLAVAAVGADPGLGAGQADRRDAERVEGHRDERRALVLAGREEHVELARIGLVGDRGGEAEELVGRVAHRAHDDDEVGSGRPLPGDPPGDALDPIRPGDRRAAELLHHEGGLHQGGIVAAGSRSSARTGRAPWSGWRTNGPRSGRPAAGWCGWRSNGQRSGRPAAAWCGTRANGGGAGTQPSSGPPATAYPDAPGSYPDPRPEEQLPCASISTAGRRSPRSRAARSTTNA